MSEVMLTDCTLGDGGELIRWNYGEHAVRNIQQLLQKSDVDIVELGLLRSQTRGLKCSVYNTTLLPLLFERNPKQLYAMLLDENRPSLSNIPQHGESTVDIVRIAVSEERLKEKLEYGAALIDKGYRVEILFTETAQYDDKELSELLNKVNSIHPWCCYIYDNSGVFTEEELRETYSIFDKVLDADIRIGFHACDNLWNAEGLSQVFCQLDTGRDICIDAAIGGIGVGALHLPTEDFAKWMNTAFAKSYAIPDLEYLKTIITPYIEKKAEPVVRFLYNSVAKSRCSYQYTEYYSEIGLEAADQINVFTEISREDAFDFSKSEANKALMRYRKKWLNMVIIVPTANRPEGIIFFLAFAARDALCCGVDIVIYDSSDDERTQAVVANFQLAGYDNVYYERYDMPESGFSIDEKVISAFRSHFNYDYIWVCRDGTIPTVSDFYAQLLSATEKGMEYIIVDWSFRNGGWYSVKEYTDCLELFDENSARMTVMGHIIFKSSTIEKVINNQPLGENNRDFWIPIATLSEMAAGPFKAVVIIANVYTYNPAGPKKAFYGEKMLSVWCLRWLHVITQLPAVYDPGKASALKILMSDFHPFRLKPMLQLRAEGCFNLMTFRRYRKQLVLVSDTPVWKFYFAALAPKFLASLVLRFEGYVWAHPDTFVSRFSLKVYHFYSRLG